MLDREGEWRMFSTQVATHIREYTIPQYQSSDGETDNVEKWTAQDCIKAIERYIKRFGSMQRGHKEALRDMLKVAHYAQLAHDKLQKELSCESVYKK